MTSFITHWEIEEKEIEIEIFYNYSAGYPGSYETPPDYEELEILELKQNGERIALNEYGDEFEKFVEQEAWNHIEDEMRNY